MRNLVGLVLWIFCCDFVCGGLAGNALFFDGIDDFATIADADHLDGMDAMTVELWFCPYDGDKQTIMKKSDGYNICSDRAYAVKLHVAKLKQVDFFAGEDEWIQLGTQDAIVAGEWIHIAATYDSINGVSRMYLNGEVVGLTYKQMDGDLILSAIRETQQNLYFGRDSAFGLLDEVRIWNVARTDTQVKYAYNKKVNSAETGLIGYWDFDEEFGNQTLVDASIYGHHGMLGSNMSVESIDPIRIVSSVPIVPEPTTLALLALGGLVMRRRGILDF